MPLNIFKPYYYSILMLILSLKVAPFNQRLRASEPRGSTWLYPPRLGSSIYVFLLWELNPPPKKTSYLVGGIPTPLKNMKVSWDYYSQYMET